MITRRNFITKTSLALSSITMGSLTFDQVLGKGINTNQFDIYKITKNKIKTNWKISPQDIVVSLIPSQPNLFTPIWSFTKNYFAPPIILKQNQTSTILTKNLLPSQTLGVHWHGLRIPNAMDGVPGITQDPIKFQESFIYKYSPPDAGSFWYHPHSNSSVQLGMGLVAPIIVLEEKPYHVDYDQIILIKDWSITRDGKINNNFFNRRDSMHSGRIGNLVTVNGQENPNINFRLGSRIRLRIINSSNARINSLRFPQELNPYIIARDGNPVSPVKYQNQWIGPGMRLDLFINLPNEKKIFSVQDNYFNPFTIFKIKTQGKVATNFKPQLPKSLPSNPIPEPNLNRAEELNLVLEGGAMSGRGMMGMFGGLVWSLNGKSMEEDNHNEKPLFNFKLKKSYVIHLTNHTSFPHPIHLHGHSFKILSYNKKKLKNPYFTDTILLDRNETADVALLTDNPGRWMIHCHIIEHQISGMMGLFEVG